MRVKVGIVGLGLVSTSHLKGYMTHPHAAVVAVCDVDEARAKQFAAAHGIPHVFTTYAATLQHPDINTVDIATPTYSGEKGMIEVLGEGSHNLLWEGQQQHLILHRDGKETVCLRFDEGGDDLWASDISYYGQGHVNQVHHLIDCIIKDEAPRYTGTDGVRAVQCTLATIRSAQEGRPVRVDEITPDYTAF